MNKVRRERVFNLIGLGLVALCFCFSLGRMFARIGRRDAGDAGSTVHFAHWQLESGVRGAFDRLAADYMRLHPDVRVEQIPVPESVYPNWLRTQLIGGTAPEIIELGLVNDNELLSTYFDPVTPYLEQPNPYNAGNDLAAVPWRDTFVDGLSHSYNQELLEYYAIPNTMFTIRMFYNRSLWKAVLGSRPPPRTYEELMDCCRRAAAYRTADGGPILPIAGSQNNAPWLVQGFCSSQTQLLCYSLAPPGVLLPTNEQLGLAYLAGKWSFHTPAMHDGLELASSIGQFLPPGFLQLRREDALFAFSQGRALMTVTGSWDAPSIRSQAPFEVGVFDVPVPTRQDPRYGHNVMGPVSEAGANTNLALGIVKQSSAARTALAIDFLRFLSSREANRQFSADSGWLPVVAGVEVRPDVQPFLPRLEGYPAGIAMGISQSNGPGSLGVETARVRDASMYRLFETDGGPAAYADAMDTAERPAVISDLTKLHRDQLEAIRRQDTTIASHEALDVINGDSARWAGKVSELDELQVQEEMAVAWRRRQLRQAGVRMDQ